ncbi:hypothetical protein [Acinetobacter sp. ANC 4173]|uniref:ORC-CDC6 family AAA ATPase n=1 Tax=Acinetobacter sp. ANC 4173 TaxID=2529837 RepID=UPI00103C1101|nr:hypothetical protein [Acinetobacter sp. ANC 4173]TCB78434.1 hypothetical protein E0H94_12050 [Acinetobacter sp. ANC 4173]
MNKKISEIEKNPFSVSTPENLSAQEIVRLFVAYPEFETLQNSGHQFLDGHRGSGKSMMLRMMCPDCQAIIHNGIDNIPYFSVYISIKKTNINNPEYVRIENELGGIVISEHLLSLIFISELFLSLKNFISQKNSKDNKKEDLINFINKDFYQILIMSGWEGEIKVNNSLSVQEIYGEAIGVLDLIYAKTMQYIKRRAFIKDDIPYTGVLFGFQDTLLPLIKLLRNYHILPNEKIYFLIDDADNLTLQQTQILNTWVSYRSTDYISLKISTQLNYKTFKTVSGISIQSPHDFSKIQFTSILTGSKKVRYPDLIKKIVEKRLDLYGLNSISADEFFPVDDKQEKAIKQIGEELKEKWATDGRGFRANDDAYRYARPEYIRQLSGNSKQGHRYSYSGFEQLVHISSGIVRFFLEPAAYMFAEQIEKNNDNKLVSFIEPSIQDEVIRKEAKKLAFDSMDEIASDNHSLTDNEDHLVKVKKLQNLIWGLGEIFKAHIMDPNASQRRLFSFTISGDSTSLKPILKLGIEHGYFYTDVRGSRDGLGTEVKYVLTRRLAAAFNLDPIGFSGDKSLSANKLLELCVNPKTYTSKLRKIGIDALEENGQISFFEGDNLE